MEEMSSLLSYQEGVDEMRQKLICTALEFEQFKAEITDELSKRNEYIRQLNQLLKVVSHERDEAKDQLGKLLNKVLPSSPNPSKFISNSPLSQNDSHALLNLTKDGNSSFTDSNCLSDVVNYNSHSSSPVDSFYDVVSSPGLSNNVGFLPHQPTIVLDSDLKGSMEMPKVDNANWMIDNLIKGKPLPEKGKFLQAVLDAPLLQTLILAGTLPKWRNPLRLQTLKIQPFPIHKDAEVVQPNHYVQMSSGPEQMSITPMFNFASSGSCLGARILGSTGANLNKFLPVGKRQRLH